LFHLPAHFSFDTPPIGSTMRLLHPQEQDDCGVLKPCNPPELYS
jgi:hypothetical protein